MFIVLSRHNFSLLRRKSSFFLVKKEKSNNNVKIIKVYIKVYSHCLNHSSSSCVFLFKITNERKEEEENDDDFV